MRHASPTIQWAAVVLVIQQLLSTTWAQRGVNRSIKIANKSGTKIAIYWVNPQSREGVIMNEGLPSGADFPLDSFVGHEFELRELPGKSGQCRATACDNAFFVVSENDEQMARVNPDFTVEFVDNKIKAGMQATDLIATCKTIAEQQIAQKKDDAIEGFAECVQSGVSTALEHVQEEISFQASVRKDIAANLENYTCVDASLESTKDLETNNWVDPVDGVNLVVHVKHSRPASRIHAIDNFIRPDECAAMEEAAIKTLHDATVADGKGGSRLSENRKAKQAGIKVPWDQPDHPISRISRRVYDYANHVLGLDIKEHGQEDLMSIQYFGRGRNDTEPDRYTPHCDGDCTGDEFKSGTRMATMVMYCTIADDGGHTNFRNAGVHVKPMAHTGIFFSYIDPESKTMDNGFTEHSGCPVFEGQKKIVTQWIRMGVSEEEPWDSFNTLGIKKSEMDEL